MYGVQQTQRQTQQQENNDLIDFLYEVESLVIII